MGVKIELPAKISPPPRDITAYVLRQQSPANNQRNLEGGAREALANTLGCVKADGPLPFNSTMSVQIGSQVFELSNREKFLNFIGWVANKANERGNKDQAIYQQILIDFDLGKEGLKRINEVISRMTPGTKYVYNADRRANGFMGLADAWGVVRDPGRSSLPQNNIAQSGPRTQEEFKLGGNNDPAAFSPAAAEMTPGGFIWLAKNLGIIPEQDFLSLQSEHDLVGASAYA